MKTLIKKHIPAAIGKALRLLFFFNKKAAIQKAYLLFSTPKKGAILPDQEFFLEQAADEVVFFNDLQLQTYRWPHDGETILLVHGWESNTYRWKVLIEKLNLQGFNIIAFDAPAQGNSSGKILNVSLYADCLQKIVELYRPNHIIGHSVGGMTTVYHQYKFSNPEIQKLVILAPPTKLTTIMDGYQKTLKLPNSFMKSLDTYFKNTFDFYFEEFSLVRFAKEITTKGLLVHDKYDEIASYSDATEIANSWKNVTFITTENFGHSLFFDEVDELIIKFLKEKK